jgi:hypothetical protein
MGAVKRRTLTHLPGYESYTSGTVSRFLFDSQEMLVIREGHVKKRGKGKK